MELEDGERARREQEWYELFRPSDDEEFEGFTVPRENQEVVQSDEEFSDDDSETSSDDEQHANLASSLPTNWSENLEDVVVQEFDEQHGPQHSLNEKATAKDYFSLFIDDEFIDVVVENTIAYARKLNDETFTTNRREISAFFGLNIFMGVNKLPSVSRYWHTDPFIGSEGFKRTIPYKRFYQLSKYIHLSNPEEENANDKLAKLRPLITLLERKFCEIYIPGKNLSVDEALVKYNGRLSFKQYMPAKPSKFGIKVWLLADADTYFVPRFQVYLGKGREESQLFREKGLGHYVVWTLSEPYLNRHRHIFVDNFFSSADLMKSLLAKNTYACATTRKNRKGFPADLKNLKLTQGEIRTRQDGNLVATVWRDKRDVYFLSTNSNPNKEIHAQMQGRRRVPVPHEQRVKPEVVSIYNASMNGVDVSDQYRNYYQSGTVSIKWWKYLMWFFFDLSIVNGYILEKIARKSKEVSARRHLDFRIALANEMIANYNRYKLRSNDFVQAMNSSSTGENIAGHSLGKINGRKKACQMCSKLGRKREDGRTFETVYVCEHCGVPLCKKKRSNNAPPCFVAWHQ